MVCNTPYRGITSNSPSTAEDFLDNFSNLNALTDDEVLEELLDENDEGQTQDGDSVYTWNDRLKAFPDEDDARWRDGTDIVAGWSVDDMQNGLSLKGYVSNAEVRLVPLGRK